jgi:hypothetical protein
VLSSAGLFAQPIPAAVDSVLWWVGNDDRAMLRELIFCADSSGASSAFWHIETPENRYAAIVWLGPLAAGELVRIPDLFVVLEPGWKLRCQTGGQVVYCYGSGHHWPGAGSAV